MAANLEVVIKGVDHASGVMRNIDNTASGLGKTMGTVLRVGALGAAAGIGAAIFAGIDFVKQAAEEEAGIKRLAAAVDAAGGSWEKQGAGIEEVIRQRQKLAFSDDDLRSSLALLTAITGDSDEALRRQAVAMDFARGANIDLGTASKLLGKVTDETVNVLGRYGIRVKEGADATDVLALVQQKFSGQSQAFADSTAGKWARVNIAFDNIKETIGAALLPVVTKLADKLATFLEEHEDDIHRISQAFAQWAERTIPQVVQGIADIAKAAGPLLQALEPVAAWFINNKTAMTAAAVALGVVIVTMFTAWAVTATAAAVATIAAAAPIVALVAVVALLAAGIFLLIKNWEQVTAWAEKHRTELTAVGIAIGILLGPFGLLIGIIILVIAHWDRVSWVVNNLVIPAFNAVAWAANNIVIPALVAVVGVINGVLIPTIGAIASAAHGVAVPAFAAFAFGINNIAIPAIHGVVWAIQNLLIPTISSIVGVAGSIGDALSGPFRTARDWVKMLWEWIGNLIDRINRIPSINVPDLNPIPGSVPIIGGQHGFHGRVSGPTLFMAGEHGTVEDVDITPVGQRRGGGGGMTFVYAPAFSSASMAEVEQFKEWAVNALRSRLRQEGI